MKSIKTFLLQIFMMAFLLPAMLLGAARFDLWNTDLAGPRFTLQAYSVAVNWGEEQTVMDLETYVCGVVLAEMPADFEEEALKAQAVVARTFAWKAVTTGGKHGDHSLCINSSCCQGYVSEENYIRYYGTEEEVKKIRNAVQATAGTVVTYGGELIEATYFSSSGGYTEDAAAVWGNDYPYLTAKESPEEEPEGEQSKAFSAAYLEEALHTRLGDDPEAWFHDWQFTNGGGVASVGIGNRTFSGTDLRKALDLRSTRFSVTIENDVVFFHTVGYGHRVGMSQYGADAMALEGKTYEVILQYYYTGTELKSIPELEEENQSFPGINHQ